LAQVARDFANRHYAPVIVNILEKIFICGDQASPTWVTFRSREFRPEAISAFLHQE
jgi:hypothetical protein